MIPVIVGIYQGVIPLQFTYLGMLPVIVGIYQGVIPSHTWQCMINEYYYLHILIITPGEDWLQVIVGDCTLGVHVTRELVMCWSIGGPESVN